MTSHTATSVKRTKSAKPRVKSTATLRAHHGRMFRRSVERVSGTLKSKARSTAAKHSIRSKPKLMLQAKVMKAAWRKYKDDQIPGLQYAKTRLLKDVLRNSHFKAERKRITQFMKLGHGVH